MNCQNCGFPIHEGTYYCKACGAPVTPADHPYPDNSVGVVPSGGAFPAGAPVKKNNKPVIVACAVIGALAVIAAAVFFVFFFNKVDLSGDYVLVSMTDKNSSDILAEINSSEESVPCKLTITKNGKGSVSCLDGSEYASFTYESKNDSMSGTVTFTESSDEQPMTLTADESGLTLRSDDLTVTCVKKDSIDLTAVKGDYLLISESQSDQSDRIEYLNNNEYVINNRLSMKGNGTGSIYYVDDDVYSKLSLNDDMTGKITYTNNNAACDVFVTVDSGRLCIYENSDHDTYVFTSDPIDLSKAGGDYTLTRAGGKDYDDYIEYYCNNHLSMPCKLTLSNNNSGTVYDPDGKSCASLSVSTDIMCGTLSITGDSDDHEIFVIYDHSKNSGEKLRVYDYTDNVTFIYEKQPVDRFESLMGSSSEIKGDLTDMTSSKYSDYKEYYEEHNYILPGSVEFKSDKTGKVLYDNGDTWFSITYDPASMTGKWKQDNNSGPLYYTIDGSTLKLYEIRGQKTLIFDME